MSETVLKEFLSTQKKMTQNATRVVLSITLLAHIIINVFAYVNHDPILKIEAPILSGITLLAILIGTRVFKHD
jgi:hypothetical protein